MLHLFHYSNRSCSRKNLYSFNWGRMGGYYDAQPSLLIFHLFVNFHIWRGAFFIRFMELRAMLADSREIADNCIQLVFRSTETKTDQKNTHDTPFSEGVQFNSFKFSTKKHFCHSVNKWLRARCRCLWAERRQRRWIKMLRTKAQWIWEEDSENMNKENVALLWRSFIMW